MSFSKDTFSCSQELVIDTLINRSLREPSLKNRVDGEIEQAVLKYTIDGRLASTFNCS